MVDGSGATGNIPINLAAAVLSATDITLKTINAAQAIGVDFATSKVTVSNAQLKAFTMGDAVLVCTGGDIQLQQVRHCTRGPPQTCDREGGTPRLNLEGEVGRANSLERQGGEGFDGLSVG